MHVKLQAATAEDAESIAALRNAVSDDLSFRHGRGPWTAHSTTAGVLADLRGARLFAGLHRGEVIGSLKLSTKAQLSIDVAYLPKVARPCYLAALAIAPDLQRQGIGRQCLQQASVLARREKAPAIFVETFAHPTAGAGLFLLQCGYRETGRASHRGIPLAYYEFTFDRAAAPLR